MKGALSLEMLSKLIIVLVVVSVGISLLFFFSDTAKDYLCKVSGKCKTYKGQIIKKESFSESEIYNYAKLCWEKVGEEEINKDFVCYTLIKTKGDFSDIDTSLLKDDHILIGNINLKKSVLIIKYDYFEDAIVIEN